MAGRLPRTKKGQKAPAAAFRPEPRKAAPRLGGPRALRPPQLPITRGRAAWVLVKPGAEGARLRTARCVYTPAPAKPLRAAAAARPGPWARPQQRWAAATPRDQATNGARSEGAHLRPIRMSVRIRRTSPAITDGPSAGRRMRRAGPRPRARPGL